MATKTKCYVTAILENTNSGFAVRADNDERIYIPPSLVAAMNLQCMDELVAVLVANRKTTSAPWVMLRGRLLDTIEEV